VKLADTIADHPKIVQAGRLLGGPRGRAEALALYIAAIGYSRHFVTDGLVPDAWLRDVPVCSSGVRVAKVLSTKQVRLFHRIKGGYRIHDFHDWNDKAQAIKEKREAERRRVADYRKAKSNGRD
jgi:hypothetical protein